jgi:ubiquinone/menaquinone biosynthesis C-methylase UbiE
VSLADYYRRQAAWRPWEEIFGALPDVRGKTILDLGCGVGDQAAALAARGARVIGVDMNEEVLEVARSKRLAGAEFLRGDLRAPEIPGVEADGLWSSFSAAYFPDFSPVLEAWCRYLKPGGWIALTEIDDFFGHGPLGERTRSLLEGYAAEALAAGRYDFRMGRKLRDHLERAGFDAPEAREMADAELAFDGPASPDVLDAWRTRLEGMVLLRQFCGDEFDRVRDEFLDCLARDDHSASARVVFCRAGRGR